MIYDLAMFFEEGKTKRVVARMSVADQTLLVYAPPEDFEFMWLGKVPVYVERERHELEEIINCGRLIADFEFLGVPRSKLREVKYRGAKYADVLWCEENKFGRVDDILVEIGRRTKSTVVLPRGTFSPERNEIIVVSYPLSDSAYLRHEIGHFICFTELSCEREECADLAAEMSLVLPKLNIRLELLTILQLIIKFPDVVIDLIDDCAKKLIEKYGLVPRHAEVPPPPEGLENYVALLVYDGVIPFFPQFPDKTALVAYVFSDILASADVSSLMRELLQTFAERFVVAFKR